MLSQIEKILHKFFHKRLCKLAQMPTIQEILQDLRPLLDVSDEQIERGDLELFVEVQRLLHVRLSSHETFFIRQLAGARPGYIEHAYLSEELARIKSAQRLCKL
jgi:hypothetical protein